MSGVDPRVYGRGYYCVTLIPVRDTRFPAKAPASREEEVVPGFNGRYRLELAGAKPHEVTAMLKKLREVSPSTDEAVRFVFEQQSVAAGEQPTPKKQSGPQDPGRRYKRGRAGSTPSGPRGAVRASSNQVGPDSEVDPAGESRGPWCCRGQETYRGRLLDRGAQKWS